MLQEVGILAEFSESVYVVVLASMDGTLARFVPLAANDLSFWIRLVLQSERAFCPGY